MAFGKDLQRNVRPATKHYNDQESVPSEAEHESDALSAMSVEDADSDEEESTSSSELDLADQDEPDAQRQISNLSFASLKEAHDTLSRKRKREEATNPDQEAKLLALRERLQRIRKEKSGVVDTKVKATSRPQGRGRESAQTREELDSENGDESDEHSLDGEQRRSKHAPAMLSTKHQVTRKRQVVDVPKRITRDPRFDALRSKANATTGNEEKAYGFLREYQKSEMQELRSAMKAAKSDEDKQTLRRKLNSMESQVKAREAKEREREIVRKHRQQEGEQVRQGKTPYFLKRADIKERALVEKFQSMKGKDREKLLERRRLKESQKEKKRMPNLRRAAPG